MRRSVVAALLAIALAGCARQAYKAVPLTPSRTATALRARALDDPALGEFVRARLPAPEAAWPPAAWSLAELTLAAFYYNPSLQLARDRAAEAQAAVLTANGRPNPAANGFLGGETAPESPWIADVGFSIPIETAGKRRYRVDAAERRLDVARWDVAATAWSVRAQVRSALLEAFAARRRLQLLGAEGRLRAEQVRLLDQRLAAGMISRPEADAARLLQMQNQLAVRAADGRIRVAEASLAAAIGVPGTTTRGIALAWSDFDRPPGALGSGAIQDDAVVNRLDVRRALADYSAAEAALRVQIANQYPDLDIGPDYAFEEGAHLFSLAASLVLPVRNRNQGPIAEAKALRDEKATEFLSTQAAGIAAAGRALAGYAAAVGQLAEAHALAGQARTLEQAADIALAAGEGDRVTLTGAALQAAVASQAELDAEYAAQQALGDLENAVQHPLLPGDLAPLHPGAAALRPPGRKR